MGLGLGLGMVIGLGSGTGLAVSVRAKGWLGFMYYGSNLLESKLIPDGDYGKFPVTGTFGQER